MMRLTQLREERGWSQSELARQAQLNQATMNQIESGRLRPYPVQLEKIAKALEVPKDLIDSLLEDVT